MTIAYLISAHTDAPQLQRLIHALQPEAEFFVHIDKKTDIRPFVELCKDKNIHFIEKRTNTRWGTYRQVDYQLALLEAAISHPTHFDRIFTLSGLDYPLWSNEHIALWLEEQGERELLQGYNMNTNQLNMQQRQLYTQYRPLFTLLGDKWDGKLSIALRKLLTAVGLRRKLYLTVGGKKWDLYKGSSWWCISEELARHVLTTYKEHPEIRKYFLHCFGPDECLIQTIAFNSPEWAPRCLRVKGEYPGLHALTPLHYIVYEPVIQVMQAKDLPTLMESKRMFARKFCSGTSEALIKELEDKRY